MCDVHLMQGFMSALELVPMWTGVDHDVEIFGSGVVTEDDGDWGAGGISADAVVPEAGGSGSGSGSGSSAGGSSAAAGSAAGGNEQQGMRLYLSQIREWVVECSCDMLFLSIRTDVAWYRLIK